MILQVTSRGMKGRELTERAEELLKLVELDTVSGKLAGRYLGGMKKRLQLACSLGHKPKLLFLDEPTTGLDPQSLDGIWTYLEKLQQSRRHHHVPDHPVPRSKRTGCASASQ